MQTCFFAISGVLPREEAITRIKESIRKTYGKRGEPVVRQNFAAVDAALEHLHEISIPAEATSALESSTAIADNAPEFVRQVTAEIMGGRGDQLPVSAFPLDGTYPPVGTSQWEKRNIAWRCGLGTVISHRVWQVRHGLPARNNSRQGVRRR